MMKRVWLMSDCPGCGQTQYQPGPPVGCAPVAVEEVGMEVLYLRHELDVGSEGVGQRQRRTIEMGGRDYPDDLPRDAGPAEPELADEEEYQRGYGDGWDAGRIAAMNQGFSDAWDAGWRACQVWLIQERRRKAHRPASGRSKAGTERCGRTGEKLGDCPCLDEGLEGVVWPPAPPTERCVCPVACAGRRRTIGKSRRCCMRASIGVITASRLQTRSRYDHRDCRRRRMSQPDISPAQPGPEFYQFIGVCDRCGLMRYEVWHYDTKRGEICHGKP